MAVITAYRPRPITFVDLLELDGWRIKLYGAAYERPAPRPELLAATRDLIDRVLPRPADGDGRYAVGFACSHDGRDGCFSFVDWWAHENELHYQIHVRDRPETLAPAPPEALTACVWDLAIIAFERQAWLDAVLCNPNGPELERHLETRPRG